MVTQCCVVTFSIGKFHDYVLYDVSPLDCVDLLLGIPYQEQCQLFYRAHTHHYHLKHDKHTYVLMSCLLKSPPILVG